MRSVADIVHAPLLPWRRNVFMVLAACAALSGCGRSSQHEEIVSELKAIRAELAEIHKDLARPERARPAANVEESLVKTVAFGTGPKLGQPSARVALIEFSDFQCPFCGRFHANTYGRIKSTYVDSGKVQYVFRNLPLAGHPEAPGAALAAHCADRQGAFWAMQRQLFGNQARLQSAFYQESAQQLHLNVRDFSWCMEQPSEKQKVAADASYGSSIGVSGTPTFFIGRVSEDGIVEAKRLVGAQPFEAFAAVIDSYLAQPAAAH